jgi:hypothetical protein
MKQLIRLTLLCFALYGCRQREPTIIIKEVIVYRDTCDSEFIRKIGQLESGNIDSVSGENGAGKGRYGIYNICVKGSGMADLLGYSHGDMYNPEKSKHVFWATMGIFCHTFAQRHGRYPTYEELARMWAGGPVGYKSNKTLRYLNKFRSL